MADELPLCHAGRICCKLPFGACGKVTYYLQGCIFPQAFCPQTTRGMPGEATGWWGVLAIVTFRRWTLEKQQVMPLLGTETTCAEGTGLWGCHMHCRSWRLGTQCVLQGQAAWEAKPAVGVGPLRSSSCFRSELSKHTGTRKENPFLLQCPCSALNSQSLASSTLPKENEYLRSSPPLSQSRHCEVDLELWGRALITGTNKITRKKYLWPYGSDLDGFC